ncbi:MAG: NAD(P)/FAD-dependent oxidoreductase, partial [Deltaproteobacteria bacterium]|nr:NAD(P)/FAD-dependent oxidoreductase [Deltaproteobacteria bacterium]
MGEPYDVIILGSGPAGLQAAIHAARKKASVMVLGRVRNSALAKAHVENFCCMDGVAKGLEILSRGRQQAQNAGAGFLEEDAMEAGPEGDGGFFVVTESGKRLSGRSLVLAMGVERKRLNVPGEKDYVGKGVSYCADCHGVLFAAQPVAVVGDGSAAASTCLT